MRRFTLIALLMSLCFPLLGQSDVAFNTTTFSALPSLSVGCSSQGVSAPFAGFIGEQQIIAGGCNFPSTPAAKGGEKVYYKDIYALQNGWWKKVGTLSRPLAYGASIQVPEGILLLGGKGNENGNEYTSTDVLLLTSIKQIGAVDEASLQDDKNSGNTQLTTLPSLPRPLAEGCASYGDGCVWALCPSDNHSTLYKMAWPNGKWQEVTSTLPNRTQACLVVQNEATHPLLYIIGGFDPQSGKTATQLLIYDTKRDTWKESPMPTSFVGSGAQAHGASFIAVTGGVNKEIFENAIAHKYGEDYLLHEKEWYHFNDTLYIYNTITDAWAKVTTNKALARAGAAFIPLGNEGRFDVVNGELKPGIRSSSATEFAISKDTSFGWINWTVLALYLIGMLAMGVWFMRRESGADDFFKGGGRIPWWAAGISIYATMLSAITYMSIPAKAFATNWTYYPMLVTILIVSFPVIKYYLPFFRKLKAASAYEYLEIRFNATTRLLASGLFIVFMVARMALVLYLPSLALSAVTGIDMSLCIILMGIVTIIYCTMGGVEAVVWGDVIQGCILVGGAIFSCVYLWHQTDGGFAGAWQIAIDNDKMRLFEWSWDYRYVTFWVAIIGGLANNLISYTSDQTVIQRYMTTKDEKSAGRSILLNGVMSVFISIAFYIIGTGLYTFYKTHPAMMDFTMQKTDAIFPFFMMSQMPAGVAGLLIAAIFAATMSTISSNINSVATAYTIDFHQRFKALTSAESVKVARLACIISGVIGVGIALLMCTWNILSLLDYFNTILGLLTSGLGGLFLIGRFFPKVGGKAALFGFVSATLVVFSLSIWSACSFMLYGAIGIIVSVIMALFASIFDKN